MNNIIDTRNKAKDALENEQTKLETQKEELDRRKESLRKQFLLESEHIHENVQLEFTNQLAKELNTIRKDSDDERSRIKKEYIDYIHNSDIWKDETEELACRAIKKLTNIGSL